jgi:IS5 family transposase
MATTLARFTSTCVTLAQKAVAGPPAPAVKRGDGGYANWVIIALHGLREHLGHTYRQLLDVLSEMPRIARLLGLSIDDLPHFTTLCHAKERLYMPSWRRLLDHSAQLHDLGEIQAIDASGFDRIAASRKYANRTNYTFKAMKTTVLVDCSSGTILDVHSSTKRPHDTMIARQLLSRNFDRVGVLTADKGYDSTPLRWFLQAHDVEPVIKFREHGTIDYARNRLQDDVYPKRTAAETAFRVLKQRFGDRLQARTWYAQFRELVLRCAVKNIEDHVKESR